MANITYDKNLQIEPPTLLLKRRDFTNIGALTASEIHYKNYFNAANELSFKVYRFLDEQEHPLWDEINDYQIICIPEYGEYFDMQVSLTEENSAYKTVACRALAESELSQTLLYDVEINTEADMARPDYDADYPTLFYRDLSGYEKDSELYQKMKHASLLHRILEKASNYSIGTVDRSFINSKAWYQFSISNENLYDVLTGEIAEQYQCLFTFDIKPDGTRLVNAYDLCNTCSDCGYRGDFHDQCPECGSKKFSGAHGKDTTIFISKDNLAASASIESNKDELKNCFRVSGGDDLMTAAVAACNPNGSNYYYCFSEEMYQSMPKDLAEKLREYNSLYDCYMDTKEFPLDPAHVKDYNAVVDYVKHRVPDTAYQKISSPIIGYRQIAPLLYDLVDLQLYLTSGMMPVPEIEGQSIDNAAALLTVQNLSPIAVSDPSLSATSIVNNAVLGMAKVYINTALYKVEIDTEHSTYTKAENKDSEGQWTGSILLTSIRDPAINRCVSLTIYINSDTETYLKQKLNRTMAKSDLTIKDITRIDLPYDDFCQKIQSFCIHSLTSAKEAYDACISIILTSNNDTLINQMKTEYQARSDKLETQISQITSLSDAVDTLYQDIADVQNIARKDLNLQSYLGVDLWRVFCSYRREDSYQNSHYLSNGLNNSEITERAMELTAMAKKELHKASHLQYHVSASLHNLLALEEFHPLTEDFECGSWIHMMVDDMVYDLRLLSYELDFDDLTAISVEFSTVEKIWSGSSDIESILHSATSIAGSYSATMSQVQNCAKASEYVETWIQDGMDATAVKIVNQADQQEILIDKTGILCRKYNDLTDSYDRYQFKIIGNGAYLLDAEEKTLKTGIGEFIYLDPANHFKETVGYGVIADVINSSIVLTKKIGIYSSNGNVRITDGGIKAQHANGTSIEIIPDGAVFEGHPGDYIFHISKDNDLIMGVNSEGDGYFKGELHADSGEFHGSITGGDININNKFKVDSDGNVTLPYGTTLSWEDGTGDDSVATKTDVTTITEQTIQTGNLIANHLRVNAANILGQLDTRQINAKDLVVTDSIYGQFTYQNEQLGTSKVIEFVTTPAYSYDSYFYNEPTDSFWTKTQIIKGTARNDVSSIRFCSHVSLFDSIVKFNSVTDFNANSFFNSTAVFHSGAIIDKRLHINGNLSLQNLTLSPSSLNSSASLCLNNTSCGIGLFTTESGGQSFRPLAEYAEAITLGTSSNKWGQIYSTDSAISTSDRTEKKKINPLDERYEQFFLNLSPVSFQLIHGTSGRTHIGFVSQDVEATMEESGLTALDFAGFCKDQKVTYSTDENNEEQETLSFDEEGNPLYLYSLRYEEFIALNTHMIQKLYKENETLKQRIEKLEQALAQNH